MRVHSRWWCLAAIVAPLSVAACELIAGVHDISLAQGTGGGAEAGPDAPSEAGAVACARATGAGSVYYVDPMNGDDAHGTGAAPACALRTITKALAVVGAAPPAGTTIQITGPAEVAGPGETFPIVVPANVTIAGRIGMTVLVPPNQVGFELAGAGAGLVNLVIDGHDQATEGVVVTSTDSANPPRMESVEVSNMGGNGIHVKPGATLGIGPGVFSHDNGWTSPDPLPEIPGTSGLFIEGTVSVTVNAGEPLAHFEDNRFHGILVYGAGSITMGGDAGTVALVRGNQGHGVVIAQTPGAGAPPSTIEGLLAQNNSDSGIVVEGGSSFKLRRSQTKGNGSAGVYVRFNGDYADPAHWNSDIRDIDLGMPGDPGDNTLQYDDPTETNGSFGIYVNLAVDAGQMLHAAGNVFEGVDCANTAATLQRISPPCSGNRADVCGNNTIDLTQCH
jgi:hypothetical protein